MERTYAEYAARQAMELLAIDSPTGFTARAADWVQRAFEELGYTARRTAKGGVLVDLGGRGEGLLLEAHADTPCEGVRGGGPRRRRQCPAGGDGGHQRGYGLRGRGAAMHRAAGIHLRQGLRRPVQL